MMGFEKLKSEVSGSGSSLGVEEEFREVRERQEVLAESVRELVGVLREGRGERVEVVGMKLGRRMAPSFEIRSYPIPFSGFR